MIDLDGLTPKDIMEAEKRAFIMMLDPKRGPHFAEMAGFTPSSDEVSKLEEERIHIEWSKLDALGMLNYISKYALWYTDVSMQSMGEEADVHMSAAYKAAVVSSLCALMLSVLSRLNAAGIIAIANYDAIAAMKQDPETGLFEFLDTMPDELLPFEMDLMTEEGDDDE